MARSKVRNCTWYFAVLMTMYVTTIFVIQLQSGMMRRHEETSDPDLQLSASHGAARETSTKYLRVSDWITYKAQPTGNRTVYDMQQAKLSVLSSAENRASRFVSAYNFTNYNFRSVNFTTVGEIYVYAANVDTRQGNATVVRLLALQHIRLIDGLMCKFFNDKKLIVFAEKYQMCENHGKQYGGWIYSCSLPANVNVIPKHVHLSTISEAFWDDMDYPQLELPPLQHSYSEKNENSIGVCVPPLFGNIPLQTLVNYIELMKILGVSKVFFYKYNISKSTENLLKYYSMRGNVNVYNWELPTNVTDNAIWYNGQLLTIQHCLYNNMEKFQFLMFVDLDEVLIPKRTRNLLSMLHSVVQHSGLTLDKIAAFSFQSAFFDSRQLPDPSQKIPLFQHLERSKKTSKVRTKLIVQTNKIFELGIHHLSRPIRDNITVVHVDPSVALVHHYRKCVVSFDRDMRCQPTVRDESMLRYSKLLETRSNKVMKEVLQFIY
ncbi:beta-1,4-galactosyltransferase galt-1-like [Gigantopelta aegis]|uniref:beta-1,4-galactosyltransferase galt-1-like n=1 Tax=Gigantopelta aegis TaxID=1735272 RepID=UPI001B88C21F|nr:beta-1,4-galactosyltransferase galt-1-like [Gigantopelta aegis]